MKQTKDNDIVVVFIGLAWEAELVKNLLENEGLTAFVTDEAVGNMFPFYTTPGMGAVKVRVANKDFDKARELVAGFEQQRGS
jgi:hypothetical protein